MAKGRKPRSVEERLMAKVYIVPESGCWIWTGKITSCGYGSIRVGSQVDGTRRLSSTHRASFECFKGEIPDGKIICHKCNVKCCVNPDHLYAGTYQDNSYDTIRSGNWSNGRPRRLGREV